MTDSLKKIVAATAAAAMLLAGPGLPIASAAGDIAAAPAGVEFSGAAAPAAPSAIPGALGADKGAMGAGSVLTLMSGLAAKADEESARAAAGDQAAAAEAAQTIAQLSILAQRVGFIDPAAAQQAEQIRAQATVFRQRLSQEQQRQIDARMSAIAAALNAPKASDESSSAVAEAAPQARASGLSRATKRAAVAAGALAVTASNALAYNGADRFARVEEPSTFDQAMSWAQTGSFYAGAAMAVAGFVAFMRGVLFQVPQGYVYVTNFLGRDSGAKTPGLKTKLPILQTIRQRLSLQSQTEKLEFTAITANQAVVKFDATMLYSVLDHRPETIKKAVYTFRSQGEFMAALKSSVEGTIRSFISTKNQSEVNGLSTEIQDEVKKHLADTVAGWGYKIDNVRINKVSFDPEVTKSMDEIVSSQTDLSAAIKNAETLVTNMVRDAEAEAKSAVTQATSEAVAQTSEGEGVAQFREEIARGLKAAVDTGLSEDFIAFMMYQDTLRKMAAEGKGNALILGGSPTAIQGMQQRIKELLAKDAAQRASAQEKDKAGSAVEGGSNSGASGVWMMGVAAALIGFSVAGLSVLPYVGAAVAGLMLLSSMVYVVPEGYVYVITNWGEFQGVKGPGLHFRLPFGFGLKGFIRQEIGRKISIQNRTQQYKNTAATTSDQANVTFNATVIYRVKDTSVDTIRTVGYKYIDQSAFMNQLQASVENSVRAIINTKKQTEILGVRQELASLAKTHLDEELAGYGYELVDLQINDINFDDNMLRSMSSVATAENRNRAAANRAQINYITRTKEAEAKGRRTEILGEARREVERQRGVGVRGFAQKASEGLEKALKDTGLSPSLVAFILALDTMRQVVATGKGNVIDMQEGGNADMNGEVRRLLQVGLAQRVSEAPAQK